MNGAGSTTSLGSGAAGSKGSSKSRGRAAGANSSSFYQDVSTGGGGGGGGCGGSSFSPTSGSRTAVSSFPLPFLRHTNRAKTVANPSVVKRCFITQPPVSQTRNSSDLLLFGSSSSPCSPPPPPPTNLMGTGHLAFPSSSSSPHPAGSPRSFPSPHSSPSVGERGLAPQQIGWTAGRSSVVNTRAQHMPLSGALKPPQDGGIGEKTGCFPQQRAWVDLLQLSLEHEEEEETGGVGGGEGRGGMMTHTRNSVSESDMFGATSFSWASASTSASADSSVIWSKGSAGGGGGEDGGRMSRTTEEEEEERMDRRKEKKSWKSEQFMRRRGYSSSDLLNKKAGDKKNIGKTQKEKNRKESLSRLQTSTSSLFDIPLPQPERKPLELSPYLTEAVNKPRCFQARTQTDELIPLPSDVPFLPPKRGLDATTQLFGDEAELFDFDREVAPLVEVIIWKTLEEAHAELDHEEELIAMNQYRNEWMERQQKRLQEEKDAENQERLRAQFTQQMIEYHEKRAERERRLVRKLAAIEAAEATPFDAIVSRVLDEIEAGGAFVGDESVVVQTLTMPQLLSHVNQVLASSSSAQGIVREIIQDDLSDAISTADAFAREREEQQLAKHAEQRAICNIRRGRLHFILKVEDIPETPPPTPPPKPDTPPPIDDEEEDEAKAGEVDSEENPAPNEAKTSESPRPSTLQAESGEHLNKSLTKKQKNSVVLDVAPDEKRDTRSRTSVTGTKKEDKTENDQDTSRQPDTATTSNERRKSSKRGSTRSPAVENSENPEGDERRRSKHRSSEVSQHGQGRKESNRRSSSTKRPDSGVPSSEMSSNSPRRSRGSTRSRARFSKSTNSLVEDESRRESRKSSRRSRTSSASVQIKAPDGSNNDAVSTWSEDASEEEEEEEPLPTEDMVVGPITVVKSSEKRDCISLEELREEVLKWVITRVPRLIRRVKAGFDIVHNGKVQKAVPPLLDSMPGEVFLKVRPRTPPEGSEDNGGDEVYPTSGG